MAYLSYMAAIKELITSSSLKHENESMSKSTEAF